MNNAGGTKLGNIRRIKIMLRDISALHTSHTKRRGLLRIVSRLIDSEVKTSDDDLKSSLEQCQMYVILAMNVDDTLTHGEVRELLKMTHDRLEATTALFTEEIPF